MVGRPLRSLVVVLTVALAGMPAAYTWCAAACDGVAAEAADGARAAAGHAHANHAFDGKSNADAAEDPAGHAHHAAVDGDAHRVPGTTARVGTASDPCCDVVTLRQTTLTTGRPDVTAKPRPAAQLPGAASRFDAARVSFVASHGSPPGQPFTSRTPLVLRI